jgi:DNA-binding NtrC family response regulator
MSSKANILVVEDDIMTSMDIEDVLMGAGYDVIGPVGTVKWALQHLRENNLLGAALDVELGSENVSPVADALAALHIPFIFVTGHSLRRLPRRHRNRPVVSKPFLPADLLSALKLAIKARTAAAPLPRANWRPSRFSG